MSEALSQLKKVFDEGYKAFSTPDEMRKMIAANPYRTNTVLAKEWERGFNRAYWESQKNPPTEQRMSEWEDKRIKA